MNNLTIRIPEVRVPQKALNQLTALYIPTDVQPGSSISLIVTILDRNVNVRELGAYATFMDRMYGRLSSRGLASYSRRESAQLKISQIRQGSWEIVITHVLSSGNATPLIILGLLLKYLPNMMKSAAEAVKHLASSYHEYEEAKLIKEQRKLLIVQMQQDQQLQQLDATKRNQLIGFLEALYAQESENLSAPKRFAEKYVKSVVLQVEQAPDVEIRAGQGPTSGEEGHS